MKLRAQVRFNNEENEKQLIQTFEVNSIVLKGREADIEIFFDNEQPLDNVEEKIERNTNHPTKRRGRKAKKENESDIIVSGEACNVLSLEEIANQANSFEEFVDIVAQRLELCEKQEVFEELVTIVTELDKISWKAIKEVFESKQIQFSNWYQIYFGKQISKIFSVTILPFLKEVKQYQNYSFGMNQFKEIQYHNRVKMECMPEIPSFEEILGSINKTKPIEERVVYVLKAMGWSEKKDKEIFEIANTAMRLAKIDFETIYEKANISEEFSQNARMNFSKFINNFVRQYDSEKKVKVLDFLIQLQRVVMSEEEFKSL